MATDAQIANRAMGFSDRIGDNIARERERVGLTQEELGVRASLHRTAVSQLERGERIPRIDTLVKIASSLGIGVGVLLEGLHWSPGGTVLGSFGLEDDETAEA